MDAEPTAQVLDYELFSVEMRARMMGGGTGNILYRADHMAIVQLTHQYASLR